MNYTIKLINSEGKTVPFSPVFRFLYDSELLIENECKRLAEGFETIVKEGTDITIEVSYFSQISQTYSVLYSYYHTEGKFIKH